MIEGDDTEHIRDVSQHALDTRPPAKPH